MRQMRKCPSGQYNEAYSLNEAYFPRTPSVLIYNGSWSHVYSSEQFSVALRLSTADSGLMTSVL